MEYANFVCSICDSQVTVVLSSETDVHLRRCQDCSRWFVLRAPSGAADSPPETFTEVTALGDPPQCPVDNCRRHLSADALAEHVVEEHDGSLNR